MLCFDFQNKTYEIRKNIDPMDFAEYLRKSGVSESSKVY